MKIETRQSGAITILDLNGDLTHITGSIALRDAVKRAVEAGSRGVLLNLQGVTTVDSSGIGEMLTSVTTLRNRGGHLKLLSPPSKVSDILQLVGLISVFEIFENEHEAVNSFE